MNTKPILAYDCATVGASVALRVGGNTHARAIGQTQQAAELVPTIDALMREHGVAYADLAAIVTTTGPGSFTGVRIGLAALHGFVAVHGIPVKLLTTLEALAWQAARAQAHEAFTVTLRAGKGEVFAQDFRAENGVPVVTSEISLQPETKADWALTMVTGQPDAGMMAEITNVLPQAPLTEAVPHYIRPPDAAVPKPYAWLRAN